MTIPLRARDPRPVGATLALGLDLALLAGAGLLVSVTLSAAFALVLARGVGLIAAPALGWRYARAAVGPDGSAWAGDALKTVTYIGVSIIIGLVVAQGLLVPVEGGIAGRLSLLVYAFFMDAIAVGLLTVVTVLPLGLAWHTCMRWFARSVGSPGQS